MGRCKDNRKEYGKKVRLEYMNKLRNIFRRNMDRIEINKIIEL